MTIYEIHKKYKDLKKYELDECVINTVFNDAIIRSNFKDTEKVKQICEMRLEGKTYNAIAELINLSGTMVRHYCLRVLSVYNRHIDCLKHEEARNVDESNMDIFKKNAKLYNVDVELLANEISKIPLYILSIKEQDERSKALLEWFCKEADYE